MCKAPKAPAAPQPERPRFLRNPILDSSEGSTVGQLRIGRSSLRTDGPGPAQQRSASDAPEFVPAKFRKREDLIKKLNIKAGSKDGMSSMVAAMFAQSLQHQLDNKDG